MTRMFIVLHSYYIIKVACVLQTKQQWTTMCYIQLNSAKKAMEWKQEVTKKVYSSVQFVCPPKLSL